MDHSSPCFQLIIVHGISDSSQSREAAKTFWASRFPRALITNAEFLDTDEFWGYSGLADRGLGLIKQIEADRKSDTHVEPSKYLPCVFLCHEFGGLLVKQALLLASSQTRYEYLALKTALIIFCNALPSVEGVPSWQHETFRLLAGSDLGFHSSQDLLKELPTTLDDISWGFQEIERFYDVMDADSDTEAEANIWDFQVGRKSTENISDRISFVVDRKSKSSLKQYFAFTESLSSAGAKSYQLQAHRPLQIMQETFLQQTPYNDWKSLHSDSPRFLYIHGLDERNSGAVASVLMFDREKAAGEKSIATYSFNKQHCSSQHAAAFYATLCQQLLQNDPGIFEKVSAAAGILRINSTLSYGTLRSLLSAIIRASLPKLVILIISGIQNCDPSVMTHVMALDDGCGELGTEVFKIALLGGEERNDELYNTICGENCCQVDLHTEETSMLIQKVYAEKGLESVMTKHHPLKYYRDTISDQLCRQPSDLNRITITTRVLESEIASSTMKAAEDVLKNLLGTVEDMYVVAWERCKSTCGIPLEPLLQWASYSCRALTLSELAVAAAICSSPIVSLSLVRLELPRHIAQDLRRVKEVLFQISNLQVSLAHRRVRALLPGTKDSSNFYILSKCLDYLQLVFSYDLDPPQDTDRMSSPEANHPEFGLVEYATVEWPKHYLATNAGQRKDQVKFLFSNPSLARMWFESYKKYTGSPSDGCPDVNSLLKIACWFGLHDLAESIFEEKPETRNDEAELGESLELAAAGGHETILRLLLDHGAQSPNAMVLAAHGASSSIVQALYESDQSLVNHKFRHGRTPLMAAVLSGNQTTASYLIDKGADCTAVLLNKMTALHLASGTGQTAIVKLLLGADDDVKAQSIDGSDALQMAAAGGFDDTVRLLLEHGSDTATINIDGMTALHLAASHGHASTIGLLIKAGAQIDRADKQAYTPIHLAAQSGFLEAIQKFISVNNTSSFSSEKASGARSREEVKPDEDGIKARKDDELLESEGDSKSRDTKGHDVEESTTTEDSGKADENSTEMLVFTEVGIQTPLRLAALNGHVKVVRELLNIGQYNSDEETAISMFLATREGHAQVVEEMLKSPITRPICDEDGNTVLHIAAEKQYYYILQCLLKHSSANSKTFDIGATNHLGRTPLHTAAQSGRLIALQVLLDHNAPICDKDGQNRTAFHIAASYGHPHVFRELCERLCHGKDDYLISDPDSSGDTPLIAAVRAGHSNIIKTILEVFPSPGSQRGSLQAQKSALQVAVQQEDLQVVETLLDQQWDVNERFQDTEGNETTSLHCAVACGNIALVKLLLGRNASPNELNSEGAGPLHLAIAEEPKLLKELLQFEYKDTKIDINLTDKRDRTALYIASRAGYEQSVQQLLEMSPNLEIPCQRYSKFTALHATWNHPGAAKLLLDAGANPMARDSWNRTPFMLAADEFNGADTLRHYTIARPSSLFTVDFNARDNDGITALHLAAQSSGTLETVKLLCKHGAAINAQTTSRTTALHYCALYNRPDNAQFLIDQGADINAASKDYGTPLMAAVGNDLLETFQLLLQNNADINLTVDDYKYYSVLQTAAIQGSVETIRFVADKIDPDTFGGELGSPLCAAVHGDSLEAAKALLETNIDANYSKGPKGTALEYAIETEKHDFVDLLLEHNVNVDTVSERKYGTALLTALGKDSYSIVKKLLDHGADPNLTAHTSGENPVQVAVRKGRKESLDILIERGARLNFKDTNGRGPLSLAIKSKSLDLIHSLWACEGVDINEKDAVDRTPLTLAVIEGLDLISDFQMGGSDINSQDRWGKTALIYAIENDYVFIASELVDCGADLSLQDFRGRDALYWASRSSSLVQMLQKNSPSPTSFQQAINATIVKNAEYSATTLLWKVSYDPTLTDNDGWTTNDIFVRYKNSLDTSFIRELRWSCIPDWSSFPVLGEDSESRDPPQIKLPTQWHPLDTSTALTLEPDFRSLTVRKEGLSSSSLSYWRLARADHPMWPQQDDVYYFEVAIEDEGNNGRRYAIGFCEESLPLDGLQLGGSEGSWGYHGFDGRVSQTTGYIETFGSPYGTGDVVGCGVNFEQEVAFYTLNGEIIGQAFSQVRGKLYPAISIRVDHKTTGCTFSVKFWETGPNGNEGFKFKGTFKDPALFKPPEKAIDEVTAHIGPRMQDSDSDSSVSDSSEDTS